MTLYVICLRRAKIQLPKSRNFTDVCIVRATHHKTFVKINFATLRSYTLFSFTFNLGNLTAEPCWRIFTTWSWSKTEKKNLGRVYLVCKFYTAISKKAIEKKNAHPTIQKGNVEYDQYAVPDENPSIIGLQSNRVNCWL